jgi:hypothetical protein
MTKGSNRIKEISDELNEHIIAVKGTLELLETSVSDKELYNLLVKAIERLDTIQMLSHEMFAVLKQVLDKMDEIKTSKIDTEGK